MGKSKSRKDTRAVVSLTARYRSPTTFEYVEEECYDVSVGGMFIRSGAPAPAGTLIKLECDGQATPGKIRGVARVVWLRRNADESGPIGMGVKFVKLEPGSKELIGSLVAQNAGGESSQIRASLPPQPRRTDPPDPRREKAAASRDANATLAGGHDAPHAVGQPSVAGTLEAPAQPSAAAAPPSAASPADAAAKTTSPVTQPASVPSVASEPPAAQEPAAQGSSTAATAPASAAAAASPTAAVVEPTPVTAAAAGSSAAGASDVIDVGDAAERVTQPARGPNVATPMFVDTGYIEAEPGSAVLVRTRDTGEPKQELLEGDTTPPGAPEPRSWRGWGIAGGLLLLFLAIISSDWFEGTESTNSDEPLQIDTSAPEPGKGPAQSLPSNVSTSHASKPSAMPPTAAATGPSATATNAGVPAVTAEPGAPPAAIAALPSEPNEPPPAAAPTATPTPAAAAPAPATAAAATKPATRKAPPASASHRAVPAKAGGHAASAPPPSAAGAEPDKPAAKASKGSPIEIATACLGQGDNNCVIDALQGKAKTAHEYELLIETLRAVGRSADAQKHMATYVQRFPDERRASNYRRLLEAQAGAHSPPPPPPSSAPAPAPASP